VLVYVTPASKFVWPSWLERRTSSKSRNIDQHTRFTVTDVYVIWIKFCTVVDVYE